VSNLLIVVLTQGIHINQRLRATDLPPSADSGYTQSQPCRQQHISTRTYLAANPNPRATESELYNQ